MEDYVGKLESKHLVFLLIVTLIGFSSPSRRLYAKILLIVKNAAENRVSCISYDLSRAFHFMQTCVIDAKSISW